LTSSESKTPLSSGKKRRMTQAISQGRHIAKALFRDRIRPKPGTPAPQKIAQAVKHQDRDLYREAIEL